MLSRLKFLFADANSRDERAAATFTLLPTPNLDGANPEPHPREILEHIADQLIHRIDDQPPWKGTLDQARTALGHVPTTEFSTVSHGVGARANAHGTSGRC